MKALTWWDFWFALPVLFVLPFIPGLMPTIDFKGRYLGGGPVREWFANQLMIFLPYESQVQTADFFNTGLGAEYSLYAIIAAHIGLILVWVGFFSISTYMWIKNFHGNNAFKAEQQALRR